ncbi:hypothetical protein ABID21_003972 [Pseudorhizobium tarimense]|uniref:Uncharacterized protein n=1 Tax=Pseudorhizobium tarimense TaxID=1079109 RepID=A0ABV2HBB9_9HYPH|nr:hypothetical protein [Pseudorhizobium tarimense]MCJ8520749.1 hypothetical protein [Pseudorhizobium tarimense]
MMQAHSYEAQIIVKARKVHLACYGRPRIINRACEKPQPKAEPVVDLVISGPMSFIRAKCAEHGLTYEEMTAKTMDEINVAIRVSIIRATVAEYPDVKISRVARLFKRSHSAINNVLGRQKRHRPSQAQVNARDARARELYDQDASLRRIAAVLDLGLNAVKPSETAGAGLSGPRSSRRGRLDEAPLGRGDLRRVRRKGRGEERHPGGG